MPEGTCSIIEDGKRCGEPTKARGWCNKHYQRWLKQTGATSEVRTCDHCGKRFERTWRSRRPIAYCSKACMCQVNAERSGPKHNRWKGGKITLACPVCSKSFQRYESALRPNWNCCSKDCDTAYRKTVRGPEHPLYTSEPKMMTCPICGTQKEVRCHSQQLAFRVCSRRCAGFLTQRTMPRTSSLETSMAAAFARANLHPEANYGLDRAAADFAFPTERLIVECDGYYWHSIPKIKARDQRRDGWLRSKGWQILRLTEADILTDADMCVARVRSKLASLS